MKKIAIGSEVHWRPSFYLYSNTEINWKKIHEDPIIEYVENLRLIPVEKRMVAAKREENYYTLNILYKCGFRGSSTLEIVEASDGIEIFTYSEYDSPLGATGISSGVLVSMPEGGRLRIYGKRSGRTYGKEKEFKLIIEIHNGVVSVKEDLPEELLKLLGGTQ
ncbi:MAG: hypothetical protein N3A69_17030 [Leptospiraceae bacterium]|nr:hypothetical protein [Leptospiraceae bacterium]